MKEISYLQFLADWQIDSLPAGARLVLARQNGTDLHLSLLSGSDLYDITADLTHCQGLEGLECAGPVSGSRVLFRPIAALAAAAA